MFSYYIRPRVVFVNTDLLFKQTYVEAIISHISREHQNTYPISYQVQTENETETVLGICLISNFLPACRVCIYL